jgi:hypothetical protein
MAFKFSLIHSRKKIAIIFFIMMYGSLFAQNPRVANGVATFTNDMTIGARYKVPDSWNKIIIEKNVTVRGNFIISGNQRTFTIEGKGWNSILDNSITEYVKRDRSLCNVRMETGGQLILKNFTSKDPANFHITAWAPILIDGMKIIETRRRTSTDAAHSNHGVTITNSFISTYDDAMYVGESNITNTIIEHNTNGGPIMVSWGGNANGNKSTFKNVTFIENEADGNYHHGVVGWAQKNDAGVQRATVEFIDCKWETKSGKKAGTFYTFGNFGNTITDGKVHQIGGLCSWATSIKQKNGSNGVVTVENCQQNYDSNDGANVKDPAEGVPGSSSSVAPSSSSISPISSSVATSSSSVTPTISDINDLTAVSTHAPSVNLTWSDVNGEQGYRVRRKLPGENYVNLQDLPANSESYTDTNVEHGLSYTYMVRALLGGVAVNISNTPTVKVPESVVSSSSEEISSSSEGPVSIRRFNDEAFVLKPTISPNPIVNGSQVYVNIGDQKYVGKQAVFKVFDMWGTRVLEFKNYHLNLGHVNTSLQDGQTLRVGTYILVMYVDGMPVGQSHFIKL